MKEPIPIIPTLKPEYKQHLAYTYLNDNVTQFLLFGGGAGGGKTWLGCEWLLTNCYKYPGTKWFISRKELKAIVLSDYVTWQKVCKYHKIPANDWTYNGQYNYIEFVKGSARGSRIDFLDCIEKPSDPDFKRLGSLEFTGGWIEEAGEVNFKAFDVLKSRIGRHMNNEYGLHPAKMLLTCNPTQNWLFRIFYKPHRDGELPVGYAFVKSLYNDNSHTRDYYGNVLNAITDATTKARLRDGLWEYTADDLNLVSYDAILDVFSNPRVNIPPQRYLTADVARFGADASVFIRWFGYEIYKVERKTKMNNTQVEAEIRDISTKHNIPYANVVVDENGVGGGVVDHLPGVNGYMGSWGAIKESESVQNPIFPHKKLAYKNIRTQCAFKLAEKINQRELSITDEELDEETKNMIIEELQQLKRVDTASDKPLQLLPKEDIKDALGRSPDLLDAMIMRIYLELIESEKNKNKYNPVNRTVMAQHGVQSQYGGVGWGQ